MHLLLTMIVFGDATGDLYSWGLSDWQIGIQSVLGHSLNFMGPQKVVNETEWKNRKVLNVKAGSSHVLVITN